MSSCDDAILKLMNEVNKGVVPFAVFWSGKHCTGESYPPSGSIGKLNTNLTSVNDPLWPSFAAAKSIFVPANISLYMESSDGSGEYIINGPQTLENIEGDPILHDAIWKPHANQVCPTMVTPASACSKLQFCFNPGDTCCQECYNCKTAGTTCNTSTCTTNCKDPLTNGTIGTIRQNPKQNWTKYIESMCTGTPFYMGPYLLNKYTPQSQTCDDFMRVYCQSNADSGICGCFSDEARNASQVLAGVDLPVKCFGTQCRANNGYLTSNMDSATCSERNCENWVAINKEYLLQTVPSEVMVCGKYTINIADATYKERQDSKTTQIIFYTIIAIFIALLIAAAVYYFTNQ